LDQGENAIKVGELLLLAVYGDLLYISFVGESNPVYWLTISLPSGSQGDVIWQFAGSFVIAFIFSSLDRLLFPGLARKSILKTARLNLV
jgi:hypothetical protein